MQVEVIRRSDTERQRLLDKNFHLRHLVRVDREGDEAVNMPDGRGVDAFDTPDSIHILIIEGGGLVGGTHLTPLDRLNLLQTAYSGLVHGVFPDHSSLGADWTHFDVVSNRREDGRRTPESAALFFSAMEHAPGKGCSFRTFGVALALVENGASADTVTPLGAVFVLGGGSDAKAWVGVSEAALTDALWTSDAVTQVWPAVTRLSTSNPPSGRIH